MHVGHLLRLDRLDLALVWGDEALLGQEIGGVTATDLEDPARFLQPREIVLSGLVWWTRDGDPGKTERFVSALSEAGAGALFAGEETHGEVPRELAEACRAHRVALIAVSARTTFRAITEAVYLRQWSEHSRRPADHFALPENVCLDLDRALEGGAPAGDLLARAFAHLGTPACHLLTRSGRTVARTGAARAELPAARAAAPASPGVAGLGDLDGLGRLIAGIPADVRNAYRETVLGPLLGAGRGSGTMLLDTLEVFLAHDCSWARTAEALHVHVNTVHYRIERVETLTGRDLSRLDHRAGLRAALLCH
ncbi:PucR family transcriptional regulator [Streptomyces sp. NPDC093089]|uniref:PucR family transcriptional regulator n=1 Tax=Streptomyces sp. NPDC093089 TaxID=3366024 RepID=UPI00381CA34C